jgi:oligoendopeptidase F
MRKFTALAAIFLVALPVSNGLAQDDTAVDPKYTWDLTELYPTVEAWNLAREEILAELPKIEERRGTLGDSAESLYEAYRHVTDTLRKGGRVFVYASLNGDEDLRVNETQERLQLARIMFAQFNEATAWMAPELVEVGRVVVES